MAIKHLVISGGGPVLIQALGAIQYLEKNNFLSISEIETIYGTSAGAIVGVIISLNFDWETINDYVIKRPWHDVFPIKAQNIFDAYTKKGLFDKTNIEKCFKPLLDAKDIPMDINLEDFYKLTNKEIHFYSFEINEYEIQDISYLTHPTLSLINAIQMTCALPILISPVCIEDKCYIDGGMSTNYPLSYCIESGKNPDEILGFKNKYSDSKNYINTDSTLLDFLMSFLYKAVFSVSTYYNQPPIQYEVIFDTEYVSFDVLRNTLSNIEIRKDLLKNGIESATQFHSKLNDTTLKDSIQELSESSL